MSKRYNYLEKKMNYHLLVTHIVARQVVTEAQWKSFIIVASYSTIMAIWAHVVTKYICGKGFVIKNEPCSGDLPFATAISIINNKNYIMPLVIFSDRPTATILWKHKHCH